MSDKGAIRSSIRDTGAGLTQVATMVGHGLANLGNAGEGFSKGLVGYSCPISRAVRVAGIALSKQAIEGFESDDGAVSRMAQS